MAGENFCVKEIHKTLFQELLLLVPSHIKIPAMRFVDLRCFNQHYKSFSKCFLCEAFKMFILFLKQCSSTPPTLTPMDVSHIVTNCFICAHTFFSRTQFIFRQVSLKEAIWMIRIFAQAGNFLFHRVLHKFKFAFDHFQQKKEFD